MRKTFLLFVLLLTTALGASAQKFALIDMEYILEKIPAYQQANQQLEQLSKQRQAEVEKATQEAKNLYESYQKALKSLSDAQRTQRDEAIIQKEKAAAELRRNYFGPEGELAQKRNELMQPIEDSIYEAVKRAWPPAAAMPPSWPEPPLRALFLPRRTSTSAMMCSPY